jgi:hypothetical protein
MFGHRTSRIYWFYFDCKSFFWKVFCKTIHYFY